MSTSTIAMESISSDGLQSTPATAEKIGVNIHMPTTNIVRWPCIQDPEGAVLSLCRPIKQSFNATTPAANRVSHHPSGRLTTCRSTLPS